MSDALVLPQPVLGALLDHARSHAPLECCGVLLGEGRHVIEAVPAANIAASPAQAYAIAPDALADALLRRRGREVVGFYHSHPAHDAHPSAQDIANWQYPDLAMVIISLRETRVAAWQVRPGVITPLEIVQDASASAGPARSAAIPAAAVLSAAIAIALVVAVALAILPPAPAIP